MVAGAGGGGGGGGGGGDDDYDDDYDVHETMSTVQSYSNLKL